MRDPNGNFSFIAFLVVVAVVAGIAAWRIFNICWKELLIPIRDRSFEHLDQVNETMTHVVESMVSIKDAMQHISTKIPSIEAKIDAIGTDLTAMKSRVEHIERNVTDRLA
jgi:peptidoglycan hydrolase CwlO-like protein